MKMDLKVLSLFIIGLLTSGLSFASESFDCPSTVRLAPGASVVPNDVPAGYESLVPDSILHLNGGGLYDGHPRDRAQLRPDTAGGGVTTWKLTPAVYPQGVWISCGYGNNVAEIVKRAKDPVTACTAVTTKKKEPYGTVAVRIDCK